MITVSFLMPQSFGFNCFVLNVNRSLYIDNFTALYYFPVISLFFPSVLSLKVMVSCPKLPPVFSSGSEPLLWLFVGDGLVQGGAASPDHSIVLGAATESKHLHSSGHESAGPLGPAAERSGHWELRLHCGQCDEGKLASYNVPLW
jgi:hypothetical protein